MINIEFFAEELHTKIFPPPLPAHKYMPQYFAGLAPQLTNNPQDATVKRCVPFLDAVSAGFIIPMWSDVWVKARDGEINIDFPKDLPMDQSLGQHSIEQIPVHPLSKTPYGKMPMKWINPWGVKTPKGYSCLFTSPYNHMEKRFLILDGVVDTDTYYNQVNFPFFWTGGDGEFFIPQGTPLVQVIPFKREKMKSEIKVIDKDKHQKVNGKLKTVMRHAYRTMFWHKKQ